MGRTLCIINTGGTISCVGHPLAPMSAKEFGDAAKTLLDPLLKEEFPDLTLVYEDTLKFPESADGTLDSTNLQPADWCMMAKFILDNYTKYDGFVVLHGTDSMDFTGSALPFLLNQFDENGNAIASLSKPVVITGSQVPMFYRRDKKAPLQINFNTDAYQNYCGAVGCALRGIPEVSVFFDAHLYRGNRVLKTNASEFKAFSSPNYPPLAEYGIELTLYQHNMLKGPVSDTVSLDNPAALSSAQGNLASIAGAINDSHVMQFNAFPAPFNGPASTAYIADLLNACFTAGSGGQKVTMGGLILESYGEGNFPSGNPDNPQNGAIYKALDKANNDGVVIVDCTQVIAGTVNNNAYASGAWLPAVGALGPADMTPMAGLAKLTILLAAQSYGGWSTDTVKKLMQLNLQGEMINVSRLDSRANMSLLPGETISALDGSATLHNDPVSGPVLIASDKTVLWSLPAADASDMPGHLDMQNDGNLVFYNRTGKPTWGSNTHVGMGAPSWLQITGSYGSGDLCLSVFDYMRNQTSAVLYRQ